MLEFLSCKNTKYRLYSVFKNSYEKDFKDREVIYLQKRNNRSEKFVFLLH